MTDDPERGAVHDRVLDCHTFDGRVEQVAEKRGTFDELGPTVPLLVIKPAGAGDREVGARRVHDRQIPPAPRDHVADVFGDVLGLLASTLVREQVARPGVVPESSERLPDGSGVFAADQHPQTAVAVSDRLTHAVPLRAARLGAPLRSSPLADPLKRPSTTQTVQTDHDDDFVVTNRERTRT